MLREKVGLSDESAKLRRRFNRLSLGDVYLGFAGSQGARHPLHRSISMLSPGDPLGTRVVNGRWELLDRSGTVVGQLAKKFEPPSGMRCDSATVFAIVTWSRDASEPRYRDGIKCDEWEVWCRSWCLNQPNSFLSGSFFNSSGLYLFVSYGQISYHVPNLAA